MNSQSNVISTLFRASVRHHITPSGLHDVFFPCYVPLACAGQRLGDSWEYLTWAIPVNIPNTYTNVRTHVDLPSGVSAPSILDRGVNSIVEVYSSIRCAEDGIKPRSAEM